MKKIIAKLIRKYYQKIRIFVFSNLEDKALIIGSPIIKQPVLFIGKGRLVFGDKVQLGYFPSPYFFDGSIHLEARGDTSIIEFGSNVYCNNNLKIVCDKSKIYIGNDVLIGSNVNIFDSDFHEVTPNNRNSGNHKSAEVIIQDNVFIGANVTILKGVTVGKNCVIANGAVVTQSFPENSIIGGVPAKLICIIN